eukprot:3713641-Rhodomonas_salina.1
MITEHQQAASQTTLTLHPLSHVLLLAGSDAYGAACAPLPRPLHPHPPLLPRMVRFPRPSPSARFCVPTT